MNDVLGHDPALQDYTGDNLVEWDEFCYAPGVEFIARPVDWSAVQRATTELRMPPHYAVCVNQ